LGIFEDHLLTLWAQVAQITAENYKNEEDMRDYLNVSAF
jgi:hypothetical protein